MPVLYYALIKGGVVQNIIAASDPQFIAKITPQYDKVVSFDPNKVTTWPSPGFLDNGDGTYSPPLPGTSIKTAVTVNLLSDTTPALQDLMNSILNDDQSYLTKYVK